MTSQDSYEYSFLVKRVRCLTHSNHFVKRVEEFELNIKKVRSDKGSGFQNARIDELCDDQSIKYEFLAKHTPQFKVLLEGVLNKGTRLSNFKMKSNEGFLLGYASNSKAYRVHNKTHGIVEEVYDV